MSIGPYGKFPTNHGTWLLHLQLLIKSCSCSSSAKTYNRVHLLFVNTAVGIYIDYSGTYLLWLKSSS